jgi:D-3-phosphoglycerate dehydrogenase
MMMQCKPGAMLINTSRGDVWDEAAVARLTASGHFSAVATDVLESELEADWKAASPLMKAAENCDRIIITPHIGGATIESMHATEEFVAKKCKAWWQTQSA